MFCYPHRDSSPSILDFLRIICYLLLLADNRYLSIIVAISGSVNDDNRTVLHSQLESRYSTCGLFSGSSSLRPFDNSPRSLWPPSDLTTSIPTYHRVLHPLRCRECPSTQSAEAHASSPRKCRYLSTSNWFFEYTTSNRRVTGRRPRQITGHLSDPTARYHNRLCSSACAHHSSRPRPHRNKLKSGPPHARLRT